MDEVIQKPIKIRMDVPMYFSETVNKNISQELMMALQDRVEKTNELPEDTEVWFEIKEKSIKWVKTD